MDAYQLSIDDKAATQVASPHAGLPEFYASHPEANRTLRMDTGGICQFCARKSTRRVELHSPLWYAEPLMYGDCCLPAAEAALKAAHCDLKQQNPQRPSISSSGKTGSGSYRVWLTLAATTFAGSLAVWVKHLLPIGLSKPF